MGDCGGLGVVACAVRGEEDPVVQYVGPLRVHVDYVGLLDLVKRSDLQEELGHDGHV